MKTSKMKTSKKYPVPEEVFVPSKEDVERAAKFINSKLRNKRVVSCNGIPADENGNVIHTEKEKEYLDPDEDPEVKQILKCLSCLHCRPVGDRKNGMCKIEKCEFIEVK